MPSNLNKRFQNRNSKIIEHINFIHDHLIIMSFINITIIIIIFIFKKKNICNNEIIENNKIETLWTIFPIITLISISIPSIIILYLTEENFNPSISIKIIGNQWYWSYEYSEIMNKKINRFINSRTNIRLLETNNPLIIPTKKIIRFIVSRNDVIHSWSISSSGNKIDAIPGRLNSNTISIQKRSILTGQCSEICGINHRFIPIWIISKKT